MVFKIKSNQDYSETFNDFQIIFKECVLEIAGDNELDNRFDINVVEPFLINSWLGALLRTESRESISNSLGDFRAFIIQQLSN
ncbi:hypothetical protein [Aestuariivivens insulae]|uniref:hypothetical protein n=1 Tax=Aestuariivivens insulae TaxID=1621988 RepID=UPI001F56CC8E|nr:hypothetical protein [Aestuariivivens insulae]